MTAVNGAAGQRAKRGQGEGSFEPLASGKVRWRAMVTNEGGERRAFSGTARNLTEARKEVGKVRLLKDGGNMPPREKVTVEQLVTAYIEHRLPRVKGRTVDNYRYVLSRYLAPLAGLKAQMVTPSRLRAFYSELHARGIGDSVRRQAHNLLHAAYRLGSAEGVVTINPASVMRPVYSGAGALKVKAFTPAQAGAFYSAARADRWGGPFAFALALGFRPGEVLGIRWEDVTLTGEGDNLTARVEIRRTRSLSGGRVYEDTPKTERGARAVTAEGDAARLLLQERAQQAREAEARLVHNGRPYEVTGYVFTTRAGTPYRPDNLRRTMRRLCKAADLPQLPPHSLRHTYVSSLAAAGVPIEVLSAQIGHARASITQDIYRTVFEDERAGLTYNPLEHAGESTPVVKAESEARVGLSAGEDV